jgi:N4-gp56 family major capsid protein
MAVSDYVLKDREALIKMGKDITVATMQDIVFKPFMGTSDTAIIKTSDEFPTETSVAKVRLRGRLTGSGAANNTDVSANRDTMTNLYQSVDYEHFANSVKSDDKNPIRVKSAAEGFRGDAKAELTEWSKARLSNIMFSRLSEGCTNIVACKSDGIYSGAVNNCSSITAGDILTTEAIKAAVLRAKTGVDGAGARHPKLRPFVVKPTSEMGIQQPLSYYLMMVDPYAAAQLKSDPVWLEAQKHAQVKGLLNNIFTGALGVFDGVVLYQVDNRDDEENYAGIHTSHMGDYFHYAKDFDVYNGAASRETSINLMLGATAGILPMQAKGMDYWEGDDDENEKMISRVSWGIAFKKAKFNGVLSHELKSIYHGKDYGVTAIVSSKE